MAFLICVCALALGVGRLTGGSIRRLRGLPIRGAALVLLAAGAQAGTLLMDAGPARSAVHGSSAVLAAAFLIRNRRLPGAPLLGSGLALNAAVMAVNGAMPVSRAAAAAAGVPLDQVAAGRDPAHRVAGDATALPWLGDVIPVPFPGAPAVFSAGDCLVAAGLALLLAAGMHHAAAGEAVPRRATVKDCSDCSQEGDLMAKRARKRRSRKKSGANHGKRPNS